MEEDRKKNKYVEVSEQEVRIEFALGCKCRTTITLKSLSTTSPIAFKVQTSSPHKFLVSPPNGLIPPSSSTTFQVILKPQSLPPSSFPRSPSDRFLIKTSLLATTCTTNTTPHDLSAYFTTSTLPTHDIKLKVLYMGPFLLRLAVETGRVDAVRQMVRRHKSAVTQLSPKQAMGMLDAASKSGKVEMLNLLLEAGLRLDGAGGDQEDQITASKDEENMKAGPDAAIGVWIGKHRSLPAFDADTPSKNQQVNVNVVGYTHAINLLHKFLKACN